MGKILDMLKGKKTYIVAFILAVAVFLNQVGMIDQEAFDLIGKILMPVGLATLRAGVGK